MTVRRELYIILIMANLQNMLCLTLFNSLIGYVIHKGVNKVLLGLASHDLGGIGTDNDVNIRVFRDMFESHEKSERRGERVR